MSAEGNPLGARASCPRRTGVPSFQFPVGGSRVIPWERGHPARGRVEMTGAERADLRVGRRVGKTAWRWLGGQRGRCPSRALQTLNRPAAGTEPGPPVQLLREALVLRRGGGGVPVVAHLSHKNTVRNTSATAGGRPPCRPQSVGSCLIVHLANFLIGYWQHLHIGNNDWNCCQCGIVASCQIQLPMRLPCGRDRARPSRRRHREAQVSRRCGNDALPPFPPSRARARTHVQ